MELSEDGVMKLLFQTDPLEFEQLFATLLEKWEWESHVTSGSNDRGVDVIAEKTVPFAQKYAIQVKQYSTDNRVGSPAIQQYSSLGNQETDIDGVIIATTSSFTADAEEVASDLGVKLIGGNDLIELFRTSKGQTTLKAHFDIVEKDQFKKTPEQRESESLEQQAFDAICDRYGRGLKGPTKLRNKSCPKCGDICYGGKIMTSIDSKEIRFCTGCETVFMKKDQEWKPKPIYL